ncbi:MAG: DUF975 family protein [Acholeplasmatales bacterium]
MYRRAKQTRQAAWAILKKHYWNVFLFVLVAALISGLGIIGVIIGGPVLVGAAYMMLRTIRNDDSSDLGLLFKEFDNFGRYLAIHLLALIKIFLWSLLFIIPGIVRSYSLSLIYFIAKEHPELSPGEVLKKSTEMMKGHKGRLFCLHFSFIGWFLLGLLVAIVTLGFGSIAFIFLMPYVKAAEGVFYQELLDVNPEYKPAPKVEVVE